jgi:hypothetical protein
MQGAFAERTEDGLIACLPASRGIRPYKIVKRQIPFAIILDP